MNPNPDIDPHKIELAIAAEGTGPDLVKNSDELGIAKAMPAKTIEQAQFNGRKLRQQNEEEARRKVGESSHHAISLLSGLMVNKPQAVQRFTASFEDLGDHLVRKLAEQKKAGFRPPHLRSKNRDLKKGPPSWKAAAKAAKKALKQVKPGGA